MDKKIIEITPAALEAICDEQTRQMEEERIVKRVYRLLHKIHSKPTKTIMEKERFKILARELIVMGGKV